MCINILTHTKKWWWLKRTFHFNSFLFCPRKSIFSSYDQLSSTHKKLHAVICIKLFWLRNKTGFVLFACGTMVLMWFIVSDEKAKKWEGGLRFDGMNQNHLIGATSQILLTFVSKWLKKTSDWWDNIYYYQQYKTLHCSIFILKNGSFKKSLYLILFNIIRRVVFPVLYIELK